MNKARISIQEAANILRVSTKTLRRWDKQGTLVPQRTAGNQRRYSRSQVESFGDSRSKTSDSYRSNDQDILKSDNLSSEDLGQQNILAGNSLVNNLANKAFDKIETSKLFSLNGARKAIIFGSSSLLVVAISVTLFVKTGAGKFVDNLIGSAVPVSSAVQDVLVSNPAVLGEATSRNSLLFSVNIPSNFNNSV